MNCFRKHQLSCSTFNIARRPRVTLCCLLYVARCHFYQSRRCLERILRDYWMDAVTDVYNIAGDNVGISTCVADCERRRRATYSGGFNVQEKSFWSKNCGLWWQTCQGMCVLDCGDMHVLDEMCYVLCICWRVHRGGDVLPTVVICVPGEHTCSRLCMW